MSIKILYVEDEVFLGKIVKESLESRGFAVIMEANGGDAFRVFEDEQPDICVLDVMLPGRSGFEIAADIRKSGSDVPIIFLTAKTQTDDVVKGFQLGGDDYIRKPFSMEELIVRIEHALRMKKEPIGETVPDIVEIGKYTFFLKRQVLCLNEVERKLSYREAELLKYLFINRNNLIERKDLLNYIWGNDSFFNSRNLDVYVTKMRSYLKEDSSIEIMTVKGVGYRFTL